MRVSTRDPEDACGHDGVEFDLTAMHGETEFLRHGFIVTNRESPRPILVTRTSRSRGPRAGRPT